MPSSTTDKRMPMVLVVEDDPVLSTLYTSYLTQAGVASTHAGDLATARRLLSESVPDIILLDLFLPDGHGHELLSDIRARGMDTPVIVVTSTGSIATAVESMRLGAYDFLVKPFSAERLQVTLRNGLELRRLKRIERHLAHNGTDRFEGFIGASPAMRAVYDIIRGAASSKASVFITGESGTGKELAAEAIHRLSGRSEGPFVALNCSAIARELVESELFGHVKGAFTGAVSARDGIASQADGGTLFLDEIGEMDLALQAKLLRFVQTGKFQPVGSDRTRTVDVRFVCATNREPLAEAQAGRFREDLYYRLNVVPIAMPPLRERGNDVLLIARHFLEVFAAEEGKNFNGFDAEAERLLLGYRWPGNVRQLLNVLRNVVVLGGGGVVSAAMLPAQLKSGQAIQVGTAHARIETAASAPVRPLWQVERDAIEAALAVCGDNVGRAAALLEIDASTIYRRRREWAQHRSG